jgi:hypothetical protein
VKKADKEMVIFWGVVNDTSYKRKIAPKKIIKPVVRKKINLANQFDAR